MFILRSGGAAPTAADIVVKASRRTPAEVPGGAGKTDYFCAGESEAMTALHDQGSEVVALRDGWYQGDYGGGVAIWGHGKYWEIRDTLFTVREAVGPATGSASAEFGADPVNIRRAIFGV
jgi:hypothetical protein